MNRRVKYYDGIIKGLLYFCSFLSIIVLVTMIGYICIKGIKVIDLTFLLSEKSAMKDVYGILGNIINTVYLILFTLLFAVPIGVFGAIFLNEYAKPGRLMDLILFTTETLAGIPSIIFGLFGMVFFGEFLQLGYSILTGALTLSIMILPLITRNTQEALKTVPKGYRDAALGLGASKWYMIKTILLPQSMAGIVTGVILSIGRIVGESAALLFTAGSGYLLPNGIKDLFGKLFSSGGSLTIEMYLTMSNAEYEKAFGIALVLLIIVLGINLITRRIARR